MCYKNLLKVCKLVLLIFSSAWAFANEPPIQYEIFSFPTPNPYHAIQTHLETTPGGRIKFKDAQPFYKAGCEDILSDFQFHPLEKMVELGYITEEIRRQLMIILELGIHLEQLVLFTQYSDIPRADLFKYFTDQVPKERLSLAEADRDLAVDKVRVHRGTLYYVRGYHPQVDDHGRLKFDPLKLPWELDNPLPSSLLRNFDRVKVPLMVELGRAHMESGALPGDFRRGVHILMTYLANEARALKIDSTKLILTAHALGPSRARHFTRLFPSRLLNSKIQSEMEADLVQALNSAFSQPLPKVEEWQHHTNSVLISSLSRLQERYPLSAISEMSRWWSEMTGGKLQKEAAIEYTQKMSADVYSRFDFRHEAFPNSKYPIDLTDYGTSFHVTAAIAPLAKVGLHHSLDKTEAWLESLDLNGSGLNAFRPENVDRYLHLAIDPDVPQGPVVETRKAIMISNMDPRLIEEFPIRYLAAVILAVADRLEYKLQNLTPERERLHLEAINSMRRQKNLPTANEVSLKVFLETYGLYVGSSFASTTEQARRLGGSPIPGLAVRFEAAYGADVKDMNLQMQQVPQTYYAFDSKALNALRAAFPEHASRHNLRPGYWQYRELVELSGVM